MKYKYQEYEIRQAIHKVEMLDRILKEDNPPLSNIARDIVTILETVIEKQSSLDEYTDADILKYKKTRTDSDNRPGRHRSVKHTKESATTG